MEIVVAICGFVLSLIINFLPTIIAFLKGSYNKFNVLLLNLIPWLISLFTTLITTFVLAPNANSDAILTIATIIGVIISFVNIVFWIAALIKAIRC